MNKDKMLKKQQDKEFEKYLEENIKKIFDVDIPEPNPERLAKLKEYMKTVNTKKQTKKDKHNKSK